MELILLLYLLFVGGLVLSTFLKRAFSTLKPQTFDIVMLGPRGVGKTSILAGISHAYEQIAKSITNAEWEELKELRLGQDRATKDKISRSISDLESTARMVQREEFPAEGINPPIDPTQEPGEFTFYLSASDHDPNVAKTITLNFHDYPGGWMRPAEPRRPRVVEKLRKAQIIIVAIDAPHMIEESGRYQENRNAGTDVLNILRDADAFASGPGVLLLVLSGALRPERRQSRARLFRIGPEARAEPRRRPYGNGGGSSSQGDVLPRLCDTGHEPHAVAEIHRTGFALRPRDMASKRGAGNAALHLPALGKGAGFFRACPQRQRRANALWGVVLPGLSDGPRRERGGAASGVRTRP